MILLENRKVRFDYDIIESLEVGIVLLGWEVKSLKSKNANMRSSWVRMNEGEAYLNNLKIASWRFSEEEQDPLRKRKLLMHKKEFVRLQSKIKEKKLTIIPYKIYLKKGRIKCEICLVKGRKKYEKKQVLKERDQQREAQRMMKNY